MDDVCAWYMANLINADIMSRYALRDNGSGELEFNSVLVKESCFNSVYNVIINCVDYSTDSFRSISQQVKFLFKNCLEEVRGGVCLFSLSNAFESAWHYERFRNELVHTKRDSWLNYVQMFHESFLDNTAYAKAVMLDTELIEKLMKRVSNCHDSNGVVSDWAVNFLSAGVANEFRQINGRAGVTFYQAEYHI